MGHVTTKWSEVRPTKGLLTWKWETTGRRANPLRWGNQPVHVISHFDVIIFTCLVGWPATVLPHLSGVPTPSPCKRALNKSLVNRCEEIEKCKIGHLTSTSIYCKNHWLQLITSNLYWNQFRNKQNRQSGHGSGEPQVGEVIRLGGVTSLSCKPPPPSHQWTDVKTLRSAR